MILIRCKIRPVHYFPSITQTCIYTSLCNHFFHHIIFPLKLRNDASANTIKLQSNMPSVLKGPSTCVLKTGGLLTKVNYIVKCTRLKWSDDMGGLNMCSQGEVCKVISSELQKNCILLSTNHNNSVHIYIYTFPIFTKQTYHSALK